LSYCAALVSAAVPPKIARASRCPSKEGRLDGADILPTYSTLARISYWSVPGSLVATAGTSLREWKPPRCLQQSGTQLVGQVQQIAQGRSAFHFWSGPSEGFVAGASTTLGVAPLLWDKIET
jgi:hypothetical protein